MNPYINLINFSLVNHPNILHPKKITSKFPILLSFDEKQKRRKIIKVGGNVSKQKKVKHYWVQTKIPN